ncbi:hypothetical protein J113_22725 [Mycobacterium tuberculosis CAS/NITR204]|uniref:DUF3499 domain-containing protein n=1 Tax=Mycobacterium tuberculosis CAS/NITR204 TaxID=1310114 RepID=R4MIG2_MYCTX|nr:hypothetical protein J113_22725 [Mycobacterium tuberculosis CAS/NITR204]
MHDSLSVVNVPRRCCRPGCPHYAVATLTFVYSDSTAVIGPLATAREPHSWDLCVGHAGRITAPRGWELVRHAGPLPSHPDEDDLVALADAVREGGPSAGRRHHPGGNGAPLHGFHIRDGDRSAHRGWRACAARAWGRAPARTSTGVARPRRLVFPCCSRPIRPASFAGR